MSVEEIKNYDTVAKRQGLVEKFGTCVSKFMNMLEIQLDDLGNVVGVSVKGEPFPLQENKVDN